MRNCIRNTGYTGKTFDREHCINELQKIHDLKLLFKKIPVKGFIRFFNSASYCCSKDMKPFLSKRDVS